MKLLMSMSKSFNIEDIVVFYGVLNQKEYNQLSSKIDVLVAPGYSEPWGIRVNESIQKEQPVICSDGLGASDVVKESNAGFVFHRGNYHELADCIAVYINDREKLQEDKNLCDLYKDNISCYSKAKELFLALSKIND
jgi:glycosyltransferase involved in cell wall biosynthesis